MPSWRARSAICMSSTSWPSLRRRRSHSEPVSINETTQGRNGRSAARVLFMARRTLSNSSFDKRSSSLRPSPNSAVLVAALYAFAVASAERSAFSMMTVLARTSASVVASLNVVTRSSDRCTVPNRCETGRPGRSMRQRTALPFSRLAEFETTRSCRPGSVAASLSSRLKPLQRGGGGFCPAAAPARMLSTAAPAAVVSPTAPADMFSPIAPAGARVVSIAPITASGNSFRNARINGLAFPVQTVRI